MDVKAYIDEYAKDYIGPVFYYCLKKTGDRGEAEELAQDIALSVLNSLKKGSVPLSFSAWVWRIAHNRYTKWIEDRMNCRRHTADEDINEYDIADDEKTPEDAVVDSEEYSLLRRELAFIASEYRELLVAHYIDGVGIRELSEKFGMPSGTVKTRLLRARKNLKDGMSMAREFGKRSYAPEDIDFVASGNQPDGLPWRAVDRKIPQNILLEASNNPSTAEELAMELGIALPYMEEEIDLLLKADLVRELDGRRYITNFFIADSECQAKIREMELAHSREYAELLSSAIHERYDEVRAVIQPNIGETEFMWTLCAYAAEKLIMELPSFGVENIFKRPCGGDWGFCGYERCSPAVRDAFINHNGRVFGNGYFGHMAVMGLGFVPFSLDRLAPALSLFAELISSGRGVDTLSAAELDGWGRISERFAHSETGGRICADVLVFKNRAAEKTIEILLAHPSVKQLMERLEVLFSDIRRCLERNSNAVLHESLDYYASLFICAMGGMIMRELVDMSILKLPDDPANSNAGMYLIIK